MNEKTIHVSLGELRSDVKHILGTLSSIDKKTSEINDKVIIHNEKIKDIEELKIIANDYKLTKAKGYGIIAFVSFVFTALGNIALKLIGIIS